MVTEVEDGAIILSDDLLELVAQLLMVRSDRKQAEEEEKELRTKLLEQMDAAQATRGLTAAGMAVVEVQTQHRRNVNRAKLEAMFPEVFAEVIEDAEVRQVKLNTW
jgi:predicted phage-related endonuclease